VAERGGEQDARQDDAKGAGRPAEQRMLSRWEAEMPGLARETIPTEHGFAILRVPLDP
jgi:hypothetical protein